MATSLSDTIKALFEKRRDKVDSPSGESVAEELSLGDLRKARAKTQVALAKELGIGQAGVSRIEKRNDLMLSTLRGYVEAMGGELRLVVAFPDRPPVYLKGLTGPDRPDKPAAPDPDRTSSET